MFEWNDQIFRCFFKKKLQALPLKINPPVRSILTINPFVPEADRGSSSLSSSIPIWFRMIFFHGRSYFLLHQSYQFSPFSKKLCWFRRWVSCLSCWKIPTSGDLTNNTNLHHLPTNYQLRHKPARLRIPGPLPAPKRSVATFSELTIWMVSGWDLWRIWASVENRSQ